MRSAGVCFIGLGLTGCNTVVSRVEGDTLTTAAHPGVLVAWVAMGLGVLAIAGLVGCKGKNIFKRVVGAGLLGVIGLTIIAAHLIQPGREGASGNGHQIELPRGVLDSRSHRVVDLDDVQEAWVHLAHRRRDHNKTRRVIPVLRLHRADGTIEELEMGGDHREPVLEHVLVKLAERGVRVEDQREDGAAE